MRSQSEARGRFRPAAGKLVLAYLCLVAGAAGLLLPLLPGIPLLMIGVALLAPEHPVRRFLSRWIPRKKGERS